MTTGYVFDKLFTQHDYPGHPECAERLEVIMQYLRQHELLPRLTAIPARPATLDELKWCHSANYVQAVAAISARGGGMLDQDTYTNQHSSAAALKAVGGVIDLTLAVLKGQLNNGFALLRPPGHHALRHHAMGFCLFANIALAARAARQQKGIERVAIIDFDVHHGNGTQAILDDDPSILFISSHQYPFYPGSGGMTEIGLGAAKGTKVNVPLAAGTDDEGVKQLYSEVVFPIIRRFQPQLILVSAGFDAHWQDPLGEIGLSLTGYHWLSQNLFNLAQELCGGQIVFVLEGGYNLQVLAPGVGNIFRLLLGNTDYDDPIGPPHRPKPNVTGLVAMLKQIHQL